MTFWLPPQESPHEKQISLFFFVCFCVRRSCCVVLCCIGALSYTQLSGPEDCCPSPVGSIVPICKWTSARCHPQTQRRRQPAVRRTKSTTTTATTTIHMSICSYRPCDLSLSIGFTTSWLRRHRRGWNRRRGTLANLAALYFSAQLYLAN